MARYQMQAPDGHTYEFEAPDDASEEDAANYFKEQWTSQNQPKQPESQEDPRGMLDQFSDLMYEGSAHLIESAGTAASVFNPSGQVAEGARQAAATARHYKTPFAKERTKRQEAESAAVEDDGLFSGLGVRMDHIMEAPGETAAGLVGDMAGPLGAGGLARKAVREGVDAAATAAKKKIAGLTGAAVTSGTIGAGSVRENYYKTIQNTPDAQLIAENTAYAEARSQGMSEKEAKDRVSHEVSGNLAAGMAIQAAIDAAAGAIGAEKAILAGSKKGLGSAVKTMAAESGTEIISGADEALQTNLAVQQVLPSTPTFKGVGTAGTEGGLLGGVAGVGGHMGGRIVGSPKVDPKQVEAAKADVERFKQKAAAKKAAPATKATIPVDPAQYGGSTTDGQPVMHEVDVTSRIYKDYVASQRVNEQGQIEMNYPQGPAQVDPNVMPNAQPPAQGEMFEQQGPPDGMPPGQIPPHKRQEGGQGELWAKKNEPRGPTPPKAEQAPAAPPEQQMDLFQTQPGQPLPPDTQPTFVSLIDEEHIMPDRTLSKTGGFSGTDSRVVLDTIEGKHPTQAFKRLAKIASNPRLGYIFERMSALTDVLEKQGIHVTTYGSNNLKVGGTPAAGSMRMNTKERKIDINYDRSRLSRGDLENTLAHEGIHAITASLIEANKNAEWRKSNEALSKKLDALNGLFITAKLELRNRFASSDTMTYVLENVHEFLAYGLTNPSVIKALKSIPVHDTGSIHSGKLRNMMSEFIHKLGDILGFRPNDFHLYSQLFAVFDSIANHPEIGKGYKDSFVQKPKVDTHAEYARLTGIEEFEAIDFDTARTEMEERPWDIKESRVGQLMRSGIRHLAVVTNHPMVKAAHTAIDKAFSEKRAAMRRIMGKDEDTLLSQKHKIPKKELPLLREILQIADQTQTNIDPDDFPSLSQASRDFIRKNQTELAALLEFHNEKARLSENKEIAAREGYTPASFRGRFRSLVTQVIDGKITPIGYVGENTETSYKKALEWVKKEHPEATITDLPPKKSKEGVDSQELESLTDLIRKAYPKVDESLLEAVRQMDNTLFGMDKREKRKLGIWGSEGNKPWASEDQNNNEFFESLFNYYDEAYTHAALQPALKGIHDMNNKFQDVAPNAKFEIDEYVKHATGRNLNAAGALANNLVDGIMHFIDNNAAKVGIKADSGKATSILRDQLTTLALGWFNTQYLAAQLIQPFQTAVPFAAMVTHRYGISDHHIFKAVGTSGLQYAAYIGNLKMKPETRQIIDFAEANGLTGQSHLEHRSAINKSRFNRGIDTIGSGVIQAGESLTRLPMFLMFTDLLRKSPQGQMMSLEKIMDTAKNLTQYSMVDYNPEQRPQIYSELGFAGSLLGTFRTYQHGNISQMKKLSQEAAKGDVQPILLMMGVLFMLGGVTGMPLFEEANELLKPFGIHAKHAALKFLPPEVSKGTLSTMTGYDLSSKYAFNRVIPDQFPMAHVQQVWKPLAAAYELVTNDIIENGEVTPQAARNVVREVLPASAKNIFDTEYNMEDTPNGKVIRGKDSTASVDLKEDDVNKRKSLTGKLLQAKPLGESLRRQLDFENSQINKSNQEAVAQIKKDIKRYWGQGAMTKELLARKAQEYVEKGGDPNTFLNGLEKYIEEKDMPYVLRGIDKGKANQKKLQVLDNKYR